MISLCVFERIAMKWRKLNSEEVLVQKHNKNGECARVSHFQFNNRSLGDYPNEIYGVAFSCLNLSAVSRIALWDIPAVRSWTAQWQLDKTVADNRYYSFQLPWAHIKRLNLARVWSYSSCRELKAYARESLSDCRPTALLENDSRFKMVVEYSRFLSTNAVGVEHCKVFNWFLRVGYIIYEKNCWHIKLKSFEMGFEPNISSLAALRL